MIANILGIEGFGDLAYAVAIGGYGMTIGYCGLERTLIRDLVQDPKRFDDYASANIMLRAGMLLVALTGILGVNALLKPESQLGAVGMAIVLAGAAKALYLDGVYDAWDRMKRHAVYLLVERSLYFVLIWAVVLLVAERLSLPIIAAFMLAATALGLALQYEWALPRLELRFGRDTRVLARKMLRDNLWVWSAVLATLSFGALSKIVLQHVSGSAELGGYAVAWQVVLLGSVVSTQIGRVGNPRLVGVVLPNVTHGRRMRFLLQYTAVTVLAACAIALPAIVIPSTLLRILNPEYASAAAPLRILGVYVIVVGIGQVATQYLVAVRRERIYSITVMLTGVLSIILLYTLIPRLASVGAALAVLISHSTAIALLVVAVLLHLHASASTRAGPGPLEDAGNVEVGVQ